MSEQQKDGYGFSTDLFVTRKSNGESIVVGGTSADTSRWIRILSNRAAQLLWFQMSQMLHPEETKGTTMNMMTAPMRDTNRPTITTHMDVKKLDENEGFNLTGWVGDKQWNVHLNNSEVERFWSALSNALYP